MAPEWRWWMHEKELYIVSRSECMWKAEMRKALVSKRRCLLVGIIYMACWVGSFETMRIGTRNITQLCEELLTISAFKRVIPLISGMGFAMSYWEEYRYQY